MTTAVDHLRAGLREIERLLPDGWSMAREDGSETEFRAHLGDASFDIEADDRSVSVAFGGSLWEDLPLRSVSDADMALAACDQVLAAHFRGETSVATLVLSTRGCGGVLVDHAVRLRS